MKEIIEMSQTEIEKLPTLEQREEALEKVRSDYKEHKDYLSREYDERVAIIEASPVSQALKDRELAKTDKTLAVSLKATAETVNREMKRIKTFPVQAYCRFRRRVVKVPSKCECEARKCTLTFTEDIPTTVDEGIQT